MLKNFFKAGFGGVGAQLVNLLTLPIIARLYAPEVYALWALIIATSAILGSIACFRYELAIVIPQNDDDASSIFWFCIFSSIGVGTLFAVSTHIPWCNELILQHHAGPIWMYRFFVPVLITSMGGSFALRYWNIRQRAFMVNSIGQIALACVTFFVQFLFAVVFSASSLGLLIGSLLGYQALIVSCLVGYKYTTVPPKLTEGVIKRIPGFLVTHYRFLSYSTPYMLFGMLRARASLLLLTYFASGRDVGLYAFSYRIMNFPVSLISGALRPVFYKETAEFGVRSVERKINNILLILSIVGTPLVVCYFFYAEIWFRLFFGNRWADAGTIGKFLVLPAFTLMFCNWMDRVMDVLGRQRFVLILEVCFSTASIVALWLGFISGGGLYRALLYQCIVLILYNIFYLFSAYESAGYSKKTLFKVACISLVISLLTIILLNMFR